MYKVSSLLSGDSQTWEKLTIDVKRKMYKSVWAKQFNDDEMQELFARSREVFWMKISEGNYQEQGKMVSFFLQIINFKVKEWWTEKGKTKSLINIEVEGDAGEYALDKSVLDLINKMDVNCKEIIHLDLQGYKHQEISTKIGVTYGTSRTRLSNCKKELLKILNQ